MTLTELKYIVAVARERHFGHAAEYCHVSQPTLSVGVKKLEAELGLGIFERGKNIIRLTERGEEVIRRAQRLLDDASAIIEFSHGQQDPLEGVFRLGAIFTIAPNLLPPLVALTTQEMPQMPLQLDEDFTANLRIKLRQGELDAIVISRPFSEPDCELFDLYDEEFFALVPRQHEFAQRTTLTLEEMAGNKLMLLGSGHCFRDQIVSLCPACQQPADGEQNRLIQGSSLDTLRHMVAGGLGITVLPASAVAHIGSDDIVKVIPFSDPVPRRRVSLALRSSFTRRQAAQVLADCLRRASLQASASRGIVACAQHVD